MVLEVMDGVVLGAVEERVGVLFAVVMVVVEMAAVVMVVVEMEAVAAVAEAIDIVRHRQMVTPYDTMAIP